MKAIKLILIFLGITAVIFGIFIITNRSTATTQDEEVEVKVSENNSSSDAESNASESEATSNSSSDAGNKAPVSNPVSKTLTEEELKKKYETELLDLINAQIKDIDWTLGDKRNSALAKIRAFWDKKDPETGKTIKNFLDMRVTNSVESLFELQPKDPKYKGVVIKKLKDKRSFSSVDEIIKFKMEIYDKI